MKKTFMWASLALAPVQTVSAQTMSAEDLARIVDARSYANGEIIQGTRVLKTPDQICTLLRDSLCEPWPDDRTALDIFNRATQSGQSKTVCLYSVPALSWPARLSVQGETLKFDLIDHPSHAVSLKNIDPAMRVTLGGHIKMYEAGGSLAPYCSDELIKFAGGPAPRRQ